MDFISKTIAVVGGGSGTGKAAARLTAPRGPGHGLVELWQGRSSAHDRPGHRCCFGQVRVVDRPSRHLGLNAGHGPFSDLPEQGLPGMFDANFFGPYLTARAALSKPSPGGQISFFSGVLSRCPGGNCSGLGAVKGAVEALTRARLGTGACETRHLCCARYGALAGPCRDGGNGSGADLRGYKPVASFRPRRRGRRSCGAGAL